MEGFHICSCLIGAWKSETKPKSVVRVVKSCLFAVIYIRAQMQLLVCGSGVSLSAVIG